MSAYNESDHPRDPRGQYTNKPGANDVSGVSLAQDEEYRIEDGHIVGPNVSIALTDPDDEDLCDAELELWNEINKVAAGEHDCDSYPFDYDDRMSDDLADKMLSGDRVGFEEDFDDTYYESILYSQRYIANDLADNICRRHFVGAEDLADGEVYELFGDVVSEQDGTDHVDDLLDKSHDYLMRKPLTDYNVLSLAEEYDEDDDPTVSRVAAISKVLADNGIDMDNESNKEAVQEMVDNGPYYWHEGVSLDIIWYGDVREATPGNEPRKLSFPDPHVVLIDQINGSGHDVQLNGSVTSTIGQVNDDGQQLGRMERAYLDNKTPGYGWDSVAGVVKSAYQTYPEKVEEA